MGGRSARCYPNIGGNASVTNLGPKCLGRRHLAVPHSGEPPQVFVHEGQTVRRERRSMLPREYVECARSEYPMVVVHDSGHEAERRAAEPRRAHHRFKSSGSLSPAVGSSGVFGSRLCQASSLVPVCVVIAVIVCGPESVWGRRISHRIQLDSVRDS